jgi:hypothetical protein
MTHNKQQRHNIWYHIINFYQQQARSRHTYTQQRERKAAHDGAQHTTAGMYRYIYIPHGIYRQTERYFIGTPIIV